METILTHTKREKKWMEKIQIENNENGNEGKNELSLRKESEKGIRGTNRRLEGINERDSRLPRCLTEEVRT